jgi:cyclopropane-fatty-acyl-phospholipid synthase
MTATSSQSQRSAAATVQRMHARMAEATGQAMPARLWDGTELGPAEASYRIVLNHPWSLRAMVTPPSDLGVGRAYIFGDIDVEGDIVEAMASGQRMAGAASLSWSDRARLARALLALPRPPRRDDTRSAKLQGRMHSKARDRAAIAFHYDLPQAFYRSFLDRNLVYSCAYFGHTTEDVDTAQARKLDLVCRKLRLQPGMRLLDIGGGYGSLLVHAARHYGVTGVVPTLSQTQVEAGNEWIAAEGLSDRVEVRLQDYRDLDERFDAIASVGMVEHVGPANLPEYYATAQRLLADGGMFLSHGIVTGDADWVRRGNERTFVSAYVFPDGGLVPAWHTAREMERGGFELLDLHQLRPHYALTLRRWIARLEANRQQAVDAASEIDYRIWRAYMAGSAHSFESRALGVVQLLGGKDATPPLGRDWMLPGSTLD